MNPAALNAALNGDMENALIASTPGGIEEQEARGQQDFVANETLPIKCPREELEKMGFVFGEMADDLFVKVKMPVVRSELVGRGSLVHLYAQRETQRNGITT